MHRGNCSMQQPLIPESQSIPPSGHWKTNIYTVTDSFCLFVFFSDMKMQFFVVMKFVICGQQPATVSRCGMIYLEPVTLGWRPIVKSWLNALPWFISDETKGILNALFEWLVQPCIDFIRHRCKVGFTELIHFTDIVKDGCLLV